MIQPYLVLLVGLPWALALSVQSGHGAWPGPDLFLMLWVYLFLRAPRGSGGYLMWLCGMLWDLLFGGQLGLGGLCGVVLWGLRVSLRLGDPLTSPLPRHPLAQGIFAGMTVAALGYLLGVLGHSFGGALQPLNRLPGLSATSGAWAAALWWPLCWLNGSVARLFSWDPDWVPEEAA